jgi:protein-L-isoaspartate(D-aspartate) O-methyltransferase
VEERVDFARARDHMVERHLLARGITDRRVLQAFRDVPREHFVAASQRGAAYDDGPLPIGQGQTISQPYIVALTCEALQLKGHERVLEIGTGSGYAAAILAQVANQVVSVERLPELAALASERLQTLGYDNVTVRCGDGTLGWPELAPYDAIAVAAGGPKVPQALLTQLAIGGRLVIPVGREEGAQVLTRITRVGVDELRREELADVRFVPLIGAQGWLERSPQL